MIRQPYDHGIKTAFVPYYPEDRFIEEFKKISENGDLLFLHQDMALAQYSNGTPVISRINSNMFKGYKRVFVGHIHLPQEFKNVIYVGTPYTESFKESDENKRVIVYDTVKDKILEIPLGVRQHVTFEYTINQLDDLKNVKKHLKADIKKNQIVRVIINAPEEIESRIKRSLFRGMNIDTLKTKKIPTTDRVVRVTENMSNLETMEMLLRQLDLEGPVLSNVLKINKHILGGLDAKG